MSVISIAGLAHVGIRVHDPDRSLAFYSLFGFVKTAGPLGPEPVVILQHPSGIEINLVLNAAKPSEPNVLMDIPQKHAGLTHIAFSCPDVGVAKSRLLAAAIAVREGPVRFATGALAIFVRDADGNVIELNQSVPDRG